MSTEEKKPTGLFNDRRIDERENPTDRRTMMRPSTKLRIYGGVAALAVAGALYLIVYLLNQ